MTRLDRSCTGMYIRPETESDCSTSSMSVKSSKKNNCSSAIAICVQELSEDGSTMDLGSITGDDLRFVHQAFITDTIRHAFAIPDVDIRLFHQDNPERKRLVKIVTDYLTSKLPGDFSERFRSYEMKKERWGIRIEKVFQDCFNQGYSNVLVLGSRTPTMNTDMMKRALKMLEESDAVFGPTPEGRYYIIGMRDDYRIRLSDFDWKSPSIYSEVANAFAGFDLSWSELEIWYAVESADDLELMARDINQYRFEGDQDTARETEIALERIISRLEP